ncbi:hypothetical protein [Helicobacter suis]|uniref:hypothetical protein n=1 Tax=Helicobacter suis TaxID=104628 RepID=UPI0013D2C022|nr:hypothetical protein [Helicobacter suis]
MQVNLEIKDSTYKECKKYAKKFGVDLETFLVSMLEKSFPPTSNSKIKEKKLQELQKVMDRVGDFHLPWEYFKNKGITKKRTPYLRN